MIQREITVVGADDRVWCDQLTGTLSAPVQFSRGNDSQKPEMAEVECRGNVVIDHLARDLQGLTSHERGQLARLTYQPADGPHHGRRAGRPSLDATSAKSSLLVQNPPASAKQAAANRTQLNFLRIDFQQGLDGNLTPKEIAFHERVRVIYGPVDSWEQELDANHPETLPPETLTVTSDDLNMNEDPLAARTSGEKKGASGDWKDGPIQLRATGQRADRWFFAHPGRVCRQRRQRRLRSAQGDVHFGRDRPPAGRAPSSTPATGPSLSPTRPAKFSTIS